MHLVATSEVRCHSIVRHLLKNRSVRLSDDPSEDLPLGIIDRLCGEFAELDELVGVPSRLDTQSSGRTAAADDWHERRRDGYAQLLSLLSTVYNCMDARIYGPKGRLSTGGDEIAGRTSIDFHVVAIAIPSDLVPRGSVDPLEESAMLVVHE